MQMIVFFFICQNRNSSFYDAGSLWYGTSLQSIQTHVFIFYKRQVTLLKIFKVILYTFNRLYNVSPCPNDLSCTSLGNTTGV